MGVPAGRLLAILPLSLVLWALPLAAQENVQEPPTAGTFIERLDVNIVNVEVVVTDRKGHPVTGLTAADFRLTVDGRETPIDNFYAEVGSSSSALSGDPEDRPGGDLGEGRPLHLTVLLDDAYLRPVHRKRVFRELRGFLEETLPAQALVALASMSVGGVRVHGDFDADRTATLSLLDQLEGTPGDQDFSRDQPEALTERPVEKGEEDTDADYFGEGQEAPADATAQVYALTKYDRSRRTLRTLHRFIATLGGLPGRRAVLYITSGISVRPGAELLDLESGVGTYDLTSIFERVADQANASGVILYVLDATGGVTQNLRGAENASPVDSATVSAAAANLRDPQELIAQSTGGRRLEASHRLKIDLADLAAELQTYYVLGFRDEAGEDPRRRKVQVEVVDRKRLQVRAREAVYSESLERSHVQALFATLMYGVASNPLDISVTTDPPEERDDGSAVLPLTVRVPLARMGLLPQAGNRVGELTVYVSTKDEAGEPRPFQKLPFHIRIPEDRFEEVSGRDGEYTLPLVVRPGDRQVVIGVTDNLGTALSTVRLDL